MSSSGASTRAVAFALLSAVARDASPAETVYWLDQFAGKLQRLDLSSGEVRDVLTNPVVVPRNLVLDLDSGKMYWEDSEVFKIQRANLDGSEVEDLVEGGDFSRPTSVVVDAGSQTMFWAQGDAIRRADTDGTDVLDLIEGQLRPGGLALDARAGKIYWDDDFGSIQRANLDGSHHEVLVTTGAFFQTPVALDVARGKMYWAASALGSAGKIQRANLDGSSVEDLIPLGLFPAEQLTLDADGGKIYWSVFFPSPAIRRANLDGSNVENVVTSGLRLPRSFAVDSAGGKVYWTEELDRKIRRADLSGGNVEDLVAEGIFFPEGIRLDLAAGKMYWTDIGTGKIQRAELTGANVEDLVFRIFTSPAGMAIDRIEKKLYWADRVTGIQRVDFDGSSFEILVRQGLNSAVSIALDLRRRKMYWTDAGDDRIRGKIQRANLDGSQTETLVLSGFNPLGDIALDLARGKMYWTESFPSRIRRANLDGSQVEDVLVTSGFELHGLAIDPLVGKMYWGESAGLPGSGIVRRANLDGTAPRNLSFSLASALTLDLLARKIYWTVIPGEFGSSSIARSDLDGTDRETVLSEGVVGPRGIALDIEESPLAGTGFAFESPETGLDAFMRIMPTVPEVGSIRRIGSAPSAVKDIALDPSTGLLYTIDLTVGPDGQRLYRQDPSGPWAPLPDTTGVSAPGFIWGLAFDGQGNLYGAGLGVYTINKHTGQAFLLAGLETTPAFVFGMAASPTGIGFLSTGLLLIPGGPLPYLALHAPDGAFVADGVFLPLDASGEGRVLFDIAWSEENLLYGVAWLVEAFTSASVERPDQLLGSGTPADFRSDLVLVDLTRVRGAPIAILNVGAPLKAVVLGLGENLP